MPAAAGRGKKRLAAQEERGDADVDGSEKTFGTAGPAGVPRLSGHPGELSVPRLCAVHRPCPGRPLCRSLQAEHPCERQPGRVSQGIVPAALPAPGPPGRADPPVWQTGRPLLLPGQRLGTERPDRREPLRPGGAGAHRLPPGRGQWGPAAAPGGGLSRRRADHQRPGAGKDPAGLSAPVRRRLAALAQSGRRTAAGGGRPGGGPAGHPGGPAQAGPVRLCGRREHPPPGLRGVPEAHGGGGALPLAPGAPPGSWR